MGIVIQAFSKFYLSIDEVVVLNILPLLIPTLIFLKLYLTDYNTVLPKTSKKSSYYKFISFFIIMPYSSTKNILKLTLSQTWVGCVTILILYKNYISLKVSNFLGTVSFKKIVLWRPLIKKISYYGLYVHTRSSFLKIFRD